MGHKVNPKGFRLGITENWHSRWFVNRKNAKFFLEEDFRIREFVSKKLKDAHIVNIDIERLGEDIHIYIKAGRPGMIIGRAGKGIEILRSDLIKIIRKIRMEHKMLLNFHLRIDAEETKKNEVCAAIVAQNIAAQIEKRIPFRRAVKKSLEEAIKNRDVLGVKIRVGGRLDGAEISRDEWFKEGKIPLQTLRANIDYVQKEAICSYGKVGIKVWIYKGEVFGDKSPQIKS